MELLLDRLNECTKSKESTNIVDWYTNTVFDVIGDLAWGEPFYGLRDRKVHDWISAVIGNSQYTFQSSALHSDMASSSQPSAALATAAVASATSLIRLQLLSRLLTFSFNQALVRLVSPELFGTVSLQFELLLNTILRGQWGFDGMIMSDWEGTRSTAESLEAG